MWARLISCVFVCGKQGNGRRGKHIKHVLWVPGLLWAGPLWAVPLWAGPLCAPLGPYGPGPCGPPPGPYGLRLYWPPWALMGRAVMVSLGPYGPGPYGPPGPS